MTKNEYIELRIAELETRRSYCKDYVLNRELQHEATMCEKQIETLLNRRDFVVINAPNENPLEQIGPFYIGKDAARRAPQIWSRCEDSHLMHTDDKGKDTVLCKNHLADTLTACENCIQPWPVKPGA